MAIILDGTDGITTPELDSSGPVAGTTANFSGNVTLGSSVLETPSGSAPSYTCRAWVNFDGTGTVAIRASGNVSSITDNGTNDYTVNFTTAMPDVNYCPCVKSGNTTMTGHGNASFGQVFSTSSYRVTPSADSNGSLSFDSPVVGVAIFR